MAERSPNEMNSEELFNKVKELYKEKKYTDITSVLSDSVLKEKSHSNLYHLSSLSLIKLGDYTTAIIHINCAIKLKKTAEYYFTKGNIYHRQNKLKLALRQYNIAIRLKPDYSKALYNRCELLVQFGEIESALDDIDKFISLKKELHLGYYTKAKIFHYLGDWGEAVHNYSMAILYKNDFATAYNNRGTIFERLGNFNKAYEDYSKALQYNPENEIIKLNYAAIQIFATLLDEGQFTIKNRLLIQSLCFEALAIINNVKELTAIKPSDNNSTTHVVHYTKLLVADIIATNKDSNNKLRYYNTAYMNDPEEGIVVLEYMDSSIKDCFNRAREQEGDNIYIGSFLSAENHEDELVMWRTYGKDENGTEGGGCSLIINEAFFDKYTNKAINQFAFASYSTERNEVAANQCLHKVIYLNKNVKNMTKQKDKEEIYQLIKKFNIICNKIIKQRGKNNKNDTISILIDKIIYHLLSEIRFFFKSSDYSFENEIRIIQFVPKDSKKIQIDYDTKPKKLYIESNNTIQPHLEKIILGPKVPNPKQWLYLDIALRQNNPNRNKPVEVSISECKYQ